MVNGLQKSILIHVDDCKFIQKDHKVNDSFIVVLREEYQSIFEDGSSTMQVKCGKVEIYPSMTLDYSIVGQVKINMFNYINKIIDTFGKSDPTGGSTNSSAAPAIIL